MQERAALRLLKQLFCCQLILKLRILWRFRTAARLPRFEIPVETFTSPYSILKFYIENLYSVTGLSSIFSQQTRPHSICFVFCSIGEYITAVFKSLLFESSIAKATTPSSVANTPISLKGLSSSSKGRTSLRFHRHTNTQHTETQYHF